MLTLALDVDGVLLDHERDGAGYWGNELTAQFGIDEEQLRQAFFARCWGDVVTGRQSIEAPLANALREIAASVDVEAVLACWFEADYVPCEASVDLARRVASAGHRIVLATNQEHRRAAYLQRRIGEALPLAHLFYSAAIGYKKDDLRFFEAASTELGLTPNERQSVVFVDDTLINVETARTFGWRAIHATSDGSWRQEVTSLFELDR